MDKRRDGEKERRRDGEAERRRDGETESQTDGQRERQNDRMTFLKPSRVCLYARYSTFYNIKKCQV